MVIRIDDLRGARIAEFLEEHVSEMRAVSPPESKHALDLEGLRRAEVTFWSAWRDEQLLGCCALKQLDSKHGEVKSMRVLKKRRGEGVGSALILHLISVARLRGYTHLWLETGAMPFFEPARRLYRRHGFEPCGPFGSYELDPNSVFMSRAM